MDRKARSNVRGIGNLATQTVALFPVRSDLLTVIKPKPSWPVQCNSLEVERNDLQVHVLAELKSMIVSAHVVMSRPE